MDNIFIKVDEKEYGPVTLEEFKSLAKEGSVATEDLIRSEDLDDWVEAGQVNELKKLFANSNGNNGSHQGKLYAVASGKGGVGKTVLTSSIGVALASMGSDVILVDGDFGGANLHTCMGILEPEYTFYDFYTLQKESLSEILLDTLVENLRIISGACGTLGLANPKYFQKQRLIRELKKLPADTVFLDLGAGSSYNIIDLFMLADEKLLIITPEPTSVYEAFGFLKVCLMRELNHRLKDFPRVLEIIAKEEINKPGKAQLTIADSLQEVKKISKKAFEIFEDVLDGFSPKLILNQIREPDELKEGKAIQAAAIELLSIHVEYLGYISYDDEVKKAV
ncbi:MAG: P-loop NTPase, partial [bacterium]